MTAADRSAGPLASAWQGAGAARLEGLLLPPDMALPVPPAQRRDVWAEPHVHGRTLAHLGASAERDRATPWPTPLASQYARYHRDGDRDTYERQVFARQRRLTRAALVAAVTLAEGWLDGACRALEALDILVHATGGALDGVPGDVLRHTVAFPHRVHLGGPWYLNHADSAARPAATQPWHALHRAARRVGDRDAQAHAAAHRRPDGPVAGVEQGLGRLLRALTDPDWVRAVPDVSPLPRDVWLPSTQVMLARRAAGSVHGLTLAVKGGHNGEHHNHNDVGSVVVALNAVPVLVDAGRPTYTAQTFGPDRYGIWTMRSAWHNLPHVRGTGQAAGRGFAARHIARACADTRAEATMDIAAAYPRPDLRHWWRTARLERHSGRVVVVDAWTLDPTAEPPPTHVHLLVAGQVRLGDGRAEVTALDGAGRVGLSWRPASAPCTATVRPIEDPMLFDVGGARLHRLAIDVTAFGPAGEFVLTVETLPPHEVFLGGAP